jgi:tRNA dimethylallyltransferase
MSGIGYAEIAQYLDQQIPLPQAMAAIKIRTHQYIKRQYTWFNRQAVEWIDITQSGWQNKAEMLCVGRATD